VAGCAGGSDIWQQSPASILQQFQLISTIGPASTQNGPGEATSSSTHGEGASHPAGTSAGSASSSTTTSHSHSSTPLLLQRARTELQQLGSSQLHKPQSLLHQQQWRCLTDIAAYAEEGNNRTAAVANDSSSSTSSSTSTPVTTLQQLPAQQSQHNIGPGRSPLELSLTMSPSVTKLAAVVGAS